MNLPSTELIAYLAGYWEGEGSLYIHCKTRITPPTLSVKVSTGDKEIIELFAETFGGNVTVRKPRVKGARRQIYSWDKSGNPAQDFLRVVLPYLRIKKHIAELALTLTFQTFGGRHDRLTDSELQLRYAVAHEVSAFNNRTTIATVN